MAILELTGLFENLNNIKHRLYYDEDVTLKFIRKNDVLLELDRGWFMQTAPTSSIADKSISSGVGFEEYFECSVSIEDEDIDLATIIELTTVVEIGEEKYAIKQYAKPRISTKKWNLRLTTFGKK